MQDAVMIRDEPTVVQNEKPTDVSQLPGLSHRIVFLDHTAKLGGGEFALLHLVRNLDRRRFHPIVILFSDGPLREALAEHGVEVYVFPLSNSVISAKKDGLGFRSLLRAKDVLSAVGYIWRLSRFIKKLRPSLVHTNSLKSDILGGLAGRVARVPVLWHVRDRISSDYLPAGVAGLFRLLCRVIPHFVVANSAATLETLKLGERNSGAAIPSGIELAGRVGVVHDGMGQDEASVSLKTARGGPRRVALVGRIARWKGQHVFIEAASQVAVRFPDVRFQIIGGPLFEEKQYEAEIRALTERLGMADRVEFLGFRSDVMQLLADVDILVHASITGEPFGQVVVEGMAAGKPVVATRGGGVTEIVVDGETGLLVPMGDAPAMASAIGHLLENDALAARMGRMGRERVLEHFTIRNTVASVERVYAEILRRTAGQGQQLSIPGAQLDGAPSVTTAGAAVRFGVERDLLFAGVGVAMAGTVSLCLRHWLGYEAPLTLPFLAPVAFASAFGGRRMGIIVAMLSTVALWYVFLKPEWSFVIHGPERVRLLVFVAVALFIILPVDRLHRVTEELRVAHRRASAAHVRLQTVTKSTSILNSSASIEEAIAALAYVMNSALSDWCAIYVCDARQQLERRLLNARNPSTVSNPDAVDLSRLIADIQAAGNEAVPHLETRTQPDGKNEISVLTLPLLVRGSLYGAAVLVRDRQEKTFSQEDEGLAEEIAVRAGWVLQGLVGTGSASLRQRDEATGNVMA